MRARGLLVVWGLAAASMVSGQAWDAGAGSNPGWQGQPAQPGAYPGWQGQPAQPGAYPGWQGQPAQPAPLGYPQPGQPAFGRGFPGTAAPPRATPAHPPVDPSAPLLGGDELGFTFRAPPGWKHKIEQGSVLLGHDTVAGMIVVWAHLEPNAGAVQQRMRMGVAEDGMQLSPLGQPRPLSATAWAGNYQGWAQGQTVRARAAGVAFQGGGGVYVVGLATPQVFSGDLARAVDALAGSAAQARGAGAGAADMVQHFAGTWKTMSSNTETVLVLHPDGRYEQRYSASYGGGFSDGGGNDLGNWGTARDDQAQGRWQVRGTRQQGTLIFHDQEGTSQSQYRVHAEKGQTYWREYWVDGELWGKQ